jgi:hypothetical protein
MFVVEEGLLAVVKEAAAEQGCLAFLTGSGLTPDCTGLKSKKSNESTNAD